jgi:pimeloyl-ACP methyl ester carboxylesterase
MALVVDWQRDLHGAVRLAFTGVDRVTGIVEAMHANIAGRVLPLGAGTDGRTRGITGLVYRTIKTVNGGLGAGVDRGFALLGRGRPALPGPAADRRREGWLAALNGVIGDHLEETGNPLAIAMAFRQGGQVLDLEPEALRARLGRVGGHLLVQVHGLCMNDLQWHRHDHDHGDRLAGTFKVVPVKLHYNTGRHISLNGRDFARLLERLVAAWPVPVERITLLGHSMGGLVARAACAHARQEGLSWLGRVGEIVYLGTPHHGAPLERGGHWLQTTAEISPYLAPIARLGRLRSAGITDLRHGNIADEDWARGDRFARAAGHRRRPAPLEPKIRHFAVAASLGQAAGDAKDRLIGDGLVPLGSALGHHPDPAWRLDFAPERTLTLFETSHWDLLSSPVVADRLVSWLAP